MSTTIETPTLVRDVTDGIGYADLPPAYFIAARIGFWGRGKTAHEAVRNCGGRGRVVISIVRDPGAYVNDYGSIVTAPVGGVHYGSQLIGVFKSVSLLSKADEAKVDLSA